MEGDLGDASPTQVAVNVSPRELAQPGYAAQVLAVLHLTVLPPSSLVLDVTEGTIMTEQITRFFVDSDTPVARLVWCRRVHKAGGCRKVVVHKGD